MNILLLTQPETDFLLGLFVPEYEMADEGDLPALLELEETLRRAVATAHGLPNAGEFGKLSLNTSPQGCLKSFSGETEGPGALCTLPKGHDEGTNPTRCVRGL